MPGPYSLSLSLFFQAGELKNDRVPSTLAYGVVIFFPSSPPRGTRRSKFVDEF